MSKDTHIEWADSTLNLQMGCDGCELWNRKAGVKHCYAGTLTDRYGGRKGYPDTFEQPKLFLDRLDAALKWSDLTGKERPHKPWLSGLPRMVFLDDMGDTFTESLAIDWLAPLLPRMAESPRIFMVLTKRGNRMEEISKLHAFPPNFWPGVSITSQRTMPRIGGLLNTRGGGARWISAEPLLGPVDFTDGPSDPMSQMGEWSNLDFLKLVIIGGESGPGARPCDLDWVRSLIGRCKDAGCAAFLKQVGSRVFDSSSTPFCTFDSYDHWCAKAGSWLGGVSGGGYKHKKPERAICVDMKGRVCSIGRDFMLARDEEAYPVRAFSEVKMRDAKGGDPTEWPDDLRVREFPKAMVSA